MGFVNIAISTRAAPLGGFELFLPLRRTAPVWHCLGIVLQWR